MMTYYDHFVIPFLVGTVFMFAVILWKWGRWLWLLPGDDKRAIGRGIFTVATLRAFWEVVCESLLHRKIFRVNPLLGYMHMSLAFGWFLLIVVGWVEAAAVLGAGTPLHAHVFFRYFGPEGETGWNPFAFVMDLLLLVVLSGVLLAWFKRMRSRTMGMKRTTRHVFVDRVALTSLWLIFPLRLTAESLTAAIKHNGGFLTGTLGDLIASGMSATAVADLNAAAWWAYSFALAAFFIAMPFSRYMHIFTEVPLIFLRRYRLRSGPKEKSFDNFQIQACSRCGICLDPCQLQRDLGIDNVQSVYFLRDRRYGKLTDEVADNCLMCGLCEARCPVGIELNILRLNSRQKRVDSPALMRYDYLKGVDRSSGTGKVGYFAGCMTLLTPATLRAMEKIFAAAGEEVWWADRDGGSCCGRPLKLSGEVTAAERIMEHNKELFRRHGITTLVTSCPICLKVFREDYGLEGIEVLHHTEYMLRLVREGRLGVGMTATTFTYHDPCELGRGSGIYEEPRELLRMAGRLAEPVHNHAEALCCGSSLANTVINDGQQATIGRSMTSELEATGADTIVTACPLCKKAIVRSASVRVADISQIVAEHLRPATEIPVGSPSAVVGGCAGTGVGTASGL